ncbi:unnamed protein product, partial [Symbiodinium sp. CCMP2456]
MLGGFIAGPEWIDACVRANVLFEPVLRLAKAIQVPKELRVHESYHYKDSLEKMCVEAARNPSANMKWTIRESRKKLTKKKALVLMSPDACEQQKKKEQRKIDRKPGLLI